LLDLFSGAGGAAMGYHRAGFDVVGVDIADQPRYPFAFHRGDALELGERMWRDFDAIHASPPCQAYSRLGAMHPARRSEYPELIEPTRALLKRIGLPYVIENVEDAPLASHPQFDGTWGVTLCGSMFGLGVERGYLRRHRLFESNVPVGQPSCSHRGLAVGVYGHGGHSGKRRMLYRAEAAKAMEIDWMTRDEMSQAIPPAFTEHIGSYLLRAITVEAAA
jgi:DNA (cytosine-5)-methyltransferase 1